MAKLPDHPHVRTILRYYDGCNAADEALMRGTFTEDVVHYYLDHAPVRGREGLARYWAKIGPRTGATWRCDHAIVHDDEAVIEWTMRWTPIGSDQPEVLRGTEWYTFRDGLIAEIRSYHCNHHLQSPDNYQLRDFDYRGRGYALPDGPEDER